MLTMQEAAKEALACQNASNLSGVLGSFHNIVINTLWAEARRLGKGTKWVNEHPICALFLDKLADLNGRQTELGANYGKVMDAVIKLAEQEFDPTCVFCESGEEHEH